MSASLLDVPRPHSIRSGPRLPRRTSSYPSPVDWRDQVLYFLLVDRFSDGREDTRPRVNRANRADVRGANWNWENWAKSGASRWQGGMLNGVRSKLGYLQDLGITAIWLSPVFKQRRHLDTYHGYGIQDFLDVDPRFGTRSDLVRLVADAHARDMRIILDVIFNHSGSNWDYAPGTRGGTRTPDYNPDGPLPFGAWLDPEGGTSAGSSDDHGVLPDELRREDAYSRRGKANLGESDFRDERSSHVHGDFEDLRDFDLDEPNVLSDLAWCFKYWIALTDCDGFRIDTLKHVTREQARNFCGSIKEFAANLGKEKFFLVAEIAGGDAAAKHYLEAVGRNLDAALDIGEQRPRLVNIGHGFDHDSATQNYFDGFNANADLGSHRNLGSGVVSILDDHDHVSGVKLRFAADAPHEHQAAAPTAIQLFTLGIPCIYYGTEQALGGPEESERQWLPLDRHGRPTWGTSDPYLREAMFGPEHPRAAGSAGLSGLDPALPGFGPFGTSGHHCFDPAHPAYTRMRRLTGVRHRFPVLRHGRQYRRETSFLGSPFVFHGAGELVAWSRILDDEEALCVVNTHGAEPRGARILIGPELNRAGGNMTVVIHTGDPTQEGSTLPVRQEGTTVYVEVLALGPSEVVVLTNQP
jgi:glycosidase